MNNIVDCLSNLPWWVTVGSVANQLLAIFGALVVLLLITEAKN
jgi:hypothetical protein